jgi:HD-GYP domain-containing protein (c-di-GMP phosphodiesterase class II)
MTTAELVLIALAGWAALSVVGVFALVPLLRSASRSEAAPVADERAEPRATSALRESGYLGIVLERLVLHACTIFAADEVCVFGHDRRARGEALVLVQGAGVDPDLVGRRLTIDWDPMVAALACGRPIAIPGELWPSWQDGFGGEPVRRAAVAPVWFGGRMQGAVSVIHRAADDEREPTALAPPSGAAGGRAATALASLGELAELVGRVLSHTDRRQLPAADPQPEIDALLATVDRTGSAAAGRSEAVAAVARRLADDLGLCGADIVELELAARLHAVGRLRTPARVLRPNGELSDSERELVRLQPLWGAEMVARIPGLEAVALIVRHCHERWDGTGYPDGLAGERIPLASRIVALADAVASRAAVGLGPPNGAFDPFLVARVEPAAFAGSGAAA